MTDQPKNAKDIFLQVIDIESVADRCAFLDQNCKTDDTLRRRVEALLAAYDNPESYFDRPAARFDVTATFSGDNKISSLSDSSSTHGRFLPGSIVAERYRIVSLLGSGGMGDVFRADDLRLGQSVALKFLPQELAKDAKRLDYFHNEVRLARTVSHPNVCRVYDIGEVDGQHFISMEYIDGEDLKTLLHRIGRLPGDKGIQIAQQLCAGLAAAHAKGVLHRDLKPANIMIDGQGQVRITDFGLATLSNDGASVAGMSGTPASMAPEQLLRGQSSAQSDIYSLGLIFYEVFAGKPAHNAVTLADLRRFHEESSAPSNPSDIVADIDPVMEAAILRCLDPDPTQRPSSVQQLALSMPGADPLAAAVAAGETPSPELVAATDERHTWLPATAVMVFVVTVIGLFAVPFLCQGAFLIHLVPMKLSADALQADAREILERLGIAEEPLDSAHGFDNPWVQLWQRHRLNQEGYSESREVPPDLPIIRFWYRQHAGYLVSNEFWSKDNLPFLARSRVSLRHPAPVEPGMADVQLDTTGRLLRFSAAPPISSIPPSDENPLVEWDSLLPEETLGFDLSKLKRSASRRTPPCAYDDAREWEGAWPDSDRPLYVQAASFRGQPVYFEVFTEKGWNYKTRPSVRGQSPGTAIGFTLFAIVSFIGGVVLAVSNYRRGRVDLKGTRRLMILVFLLNMISWFCQADHVPFPFIELRSMITGSSISIFMSCMIGLLYIAIEPVARRFWPRLLISWTRALNGRWKDPLVGRDILVGVFTSVIVSYFVLGMIYYNSQAMLPTQPKFLLGSQELCAFLASEMSMHLIGALSMLLTLVLLRIVVRSTIMAGILLIAVAAFMALGQLQLPVSMLPILAIAIAISIVAFLRYGFLCYVVYLLTVHLQGFPHTNDFHSFYAERGVFLLFMLATVSAYGLYLVLSRGGNSKVRVET